MDSAFEVHILNEAGIEKAKIIAQKFDTFLSELIVLWGNPGWNRETALVRTKLEEASFFAKKTMANQSENQKGNQ
jgi:hypothetical protein